ncbi:MAG: MinD/ParA family protein [bacterium]
MDQAESLRQLVRSKRGSKQAPKEEDTREDYGHYTTTKVITVASGKGGVGKSNFTVNLAIELSKMGNRVMILDADLGLANVDIIMGINPKFNLTHLIKEEKDIKDIITETEYGVKLIASGSGVKELVNMSNQQREKFILKLSEIEDMVDILLIDTGAGISKNTLSFIYAADYTIVITTPEPTALMDAYGLIKVASSGKKSVALKLVVNMVSSKDEAKEIASRVILLSRRFLNIFVESYGYIYRDRSVLNSVMAQKPFAAMFPDSRATACVREIAKKVSARFVKENEKLIEQETPEATGIGGVFKKVFDLFTK